MFLTLKSGTPIPMPSAFASREREMTHPSLFESTTTGLPVRAASKTRSQET
jgi:hypothetical protein